MEQQTLPNDSIDPATEAFSKIQEELALLRAAVSGMAKDRRELVIPDYTETLIKMSDHINSTGKHLRALASRPALELTPEMLGKQIANAGAEARKEEQDALTTASQVIVATTRELLPYIESARTERIQNFWLAAALTLGLTLGLTMGLVMPGPVDRAMPESWHWPEKAAANVLDRNMWDAGERLQAVADHERWELRSRIERMTADSKDRIALCLSTAAKASAPIKCNFVFKPD